nr:hypothetical protein [Actinomadura luzonensis]
MTGRTDTGRDRPLLRDRRFVLLWCGATASGLGTWALPFVLGLAVLDGTLTATGLGVVLAARTAGFLAAVPIGGVLADRYARRAVVLWAGLAAAAASPVLAAGLGRSAAAHGGGGGGRRRGAGPAGPRSRRSPRRWSRTGGAGGPTPR